jgi:hypothetical protein
MQTPEAKVKQKIKRLLKHLGVWYFMPVAGRYAKKGIPDFICCANGKFLAIEAKGGGGRATDLQLYVIDEIQKHNGTALVIDETNLPHLERTIANLVAKELYA